MKLGRLPGTLAFLVLLSSALPASSTDTTTTGDIPRADSAVAPAWGENIRLNDDVGLADQWYPRIEANKDGDAYAIWMDRRNGRFYDIYTSHRPAVGAWGPNQRANNDENVGYAPSIGVDGSGNAFALWSAGRNMVFAYRPAGGEWGDYARVNDVEGTAFPYSAIGVDDAGNAYAVWHDCRNSSDNWCGNLIEDLYSAYRPAGGDWTSMGRVNDVLGTTRGGGGLVVPAMATDDDGTAYAVWVDVRNGDPDIYFAYHPQGGDWSVNEQVNGEVTSASGPDIAVGGLGSVYVVWNSIGPTPDVFFNYRQAGESFQAGTVERVSDDVVSARQGAITIGVDGTENATSLWIDRRNGFDNDIFDDVYSAYRPAGGEWTANTRVNDDGAGYPGQAYSDLAVDTLGNAYAVWMDRREGNWDIYFSTTAPVQSLCTISAVPLIKQSALPWGPDRYDHSSRTIGEWGCTLTSAVMIINHHGAQVGVSTTPRELNEWLRGQNDGFLCAPRSASCSLVNLEAVARFAQERGVPLYYHGRLDGIDNTVLRRYLCDLDPVILALELNNNPHDGPDHYVVATGEALLDGTETWTLNDPGNYNAVDLRHFANTYQGIRLLSRAPATPALFLGTTPTFQFLVADPEGRKTGLDASTGEILYEIPGSAYAFEHLIDDEDPNGEASPVQYVFELFHPMEGTYTVQVWGSESMEYSAYFFGYDDEGNPSTASDIGMTTPGSVHTYLVDYSNMPGQGTTIQVLVQIDIKPGSEPNPVSLKSKGTIPVVILSAPGFDAPGQVNPNSLTFGATGDEDSLDRRGKDPVANCSAEDVNADGLADLVCHFSIEKAGFEHGATAGFLGGQTTYGTAITGSDAILVVP
jgi:hypothetical protein